MPRDVQVVDAGPVDTGEVRRPEVGKGRVFADIGYRRVPFQDLFFHLEPRHMVIIGPDIVVVDAIGLEKVADALPEGIDADLRNIRHVIAQPGHADGVIQFRPANMAGKMFHFFQRPHFFSNQQAHGFADSKYFTHSNITLYKNEPPTKATHLDINLFLQRQWFNTSNQEEIR